MALFFTSPFQNLLGAANKALGHSRDSVTCRGCYSWAQSWTPFHERIKRNEFVLTLLAAAFLKPVQLLAVLASW